MLHKTFWAILTLSILLFIPFTRGKAHGEPTLKVEPASVPAGGEITVTGSEMEGGEVFALTLEGMFNTFELGEAIVSGEGFTINLTIPVDAAPGLYTLRASTEEEESTSVELTVLAANGETDNGEARVANEPSAEKMALERPRTTATWLLSGVIVLAGGAGGLWLIRRKEN